MKTIFASLIALTLAASAFAVEVGKPAPDFTGTDINGKTVKLSDYKGKIVVIESYNSDCPFDLNHYQTGSMQGLQKDYAAKGVVWLLVNSVDPSNPHHRTPDAAKKEVADLKINATAWLDDSAGTIGHLYDMKNTPQMFIVNQDGKLAYNGAIDDKPDADHDPKTAKNYVRAALDEIIAGKAVTTPETKPYGCSVKYAGVK